jgi:hypothetical protein
MYAVSKKRETKNYEGDAEMRLPLELSLLQMY